MLVLVHDGTESMVGDVDFFLGKLACKLLEKMRKAKAATTIEKHSRRYLTKTAYGRIKSSAIVLQTALRAVAARRDFMYRRRCRAATVIQVTFIRIISLIYLGKVSYNDQISVLIVSLALS